LKSIVVKVLDTHINKSNKKGDQYLNAIASSNKSFELLLHFIPGAEQFFSLFWNYVQLLPCKTLDQPLFDKAMHQALVSVNPLGLSPMSVDAHQNGFPILITEVLNCATDLLFLRVTNSEGICWSPLTGPISAFADKETLLTIDLQAATPTVQQIKIFKTVVLSNCLSLPQLSSLAHRWDLVAP